MAYTVPTAADLEARFPEFASVDDAIVTAAITEAGLQVDQSWSEADYTLALMLLAAHTLTLEGRGTGTQAQLAAVGDFSRIKSGDLEVQRAQKTGAGGFSANDVLASTNYGARFLEIRARNFPSILII